MGGQTLGYAYLPGLQGSNQSWRDGPVVDYQHFGSIEAANSSDGRTSTHEIGHYLGLSHTFCENGGGCCDNDNNSWFGLNVDDTLLLMMFILEVLIHLLIITPVMI